MITAPHSKKRGLTIRDDGGESSSGIMMMDLDKDDEDVIEIPPPPMFSSSRKAYKQKEVMQYDVIDVDDYEDSDDIIMLNGIGWAGKGKSPAPSQNPGGAAAGIKTPQSKIGPSPFLIDEFYAELDPYECYDHEIAMMQAHFDSLDTPTGVEASIPWWPYPAISKETDVSAKMPSSSSLQSLDKAGSGRSNQFQTSKFTQPLQTVSTQPKPLHRSVRRATSTSSSHNGVHPKSNGGASYMMMNPKSYGITVHPDGLFGNNSSPGSNGFSQSGGPSNPYSQYTPSLPTPSFTQTSKTQLSHVPMYDMIPSSLGKLGIPPGSSGIVPSNYTPYKSVGGGFAGGFTGGFAGEFIGGYAGGFSTFSTSDNPLIHDYNNMRGKVSIPDDFVFESKGDGNEDDLLKKLDAFKRFDVVEDHSDHHYSTKANGSAQPSKKLVKAIQEEWKILEKDLPDTIFVRVYETRMDLLRAVIMGAEGTPYHDGIFFFDVHFPFDYPNKPPNVYYHSGGLRLNPNLYNCGKVCLSLLNTWSGSKDEKWKPGYSTILQVLVSIQGLVLNSNPYFNEPGYASSNGTPSGEQRSDQYNENTFLLSLKTMLYSMRRPPKYFEDFVYGHFFQHARKILEACQAYKNGAQIGRIVGGSSSKATGSHRGGSSSGSGSYCSNTLKSSLPGHVKPLVEAFTKIGVKDCDKYFQLDN